MIGRARVRTAGPAKRTKLRVGAAIGAFRLALN
jgi:hypothetical protein